jgi:hypothetical protein
METAYDRWKTSEPKSSEPTEQWEKAREMLSDAERIYKNLPNSRELSWNALTPKKRSIYTHQKIRLEKFMYALQEVVERDTCAGCGEYSEHGILHGSRCRAEYRAGMDW